MHETYTICITNEHPIQLRITEIDVMVTGATLEEATEKATLAINEYRKSVWLKEQQQALQHSA
jgi:hypothetical protein